MRDEVLNYYFNYKLLLCLEVLSVRPISEMIWKQGVLVIV